MNRIFPPTASRIGATLLALGLLAGCSVTTNGASSADTLSVQQFASEIAPIRLDVNESFDRWKERTCSSLAIADGDVLCHGNALILGSTVQTAYIKLNTITNTSASGYVGQPPAEISDLYQETLKVAAKAHDSGKAFQESGCEEKECIGLTVDLIGDAEDLRGTLEKWAPYLS